MNRKRKPSQRKRANQKIVRNRRGKRLGQHVLDVKVKRREGESIRRHIRLPLVAKVAGVVLLLALLGFIGSNVLGRFLWNNPAYTLKTIEFETDGALTRALALEIAEVETEVNVLRLDLDEIRDRLVALAQVKDASVVRVLPDKLGISVEERHPIAWLDCPEQNIFPKVQAKGILLDAEGVALPCRQMRHHYVNFPIITVKGLAAVKPGKPIDSDQLLSALELATISNDVFYDHGLEVVKIELVKDYYLLARFNNHTSVKFKPSDIGRQVDDLRAIFEDSLKKNRLLETVDLLPDRNIPITYVRNMPTEAPRAQPLEYPVARPLEQSRAAAAEPHAVSDQPRQARRAMRVRRSIPVADTPIDDLTSIVTPAE